MRIRGYRYHNTCRECGCPLDAGEGDYCEECLEEFARAEAYARQWHLTVEQARELVREGLVSA
ncbi:hypothetical protein [Clostridium sp. AN503]|uniref:hypothetical protein n=1 Tax=Clostridium sp. AN503 TaxID=3160598 RepID=UPI003458B12B